MSRDSQVEGEDEMDTSEPQTSLNESAAVLTIEGEN